MSSIKAGTGAIGANARSDTGGGGLLLVGTPVAQLIRILSASIAPVIVISGVGLLLLSMTNRHSRVIERARELIKDLDASGEEPRRKLLVEQIQIVYRRARILRLAITLSAVSILFVAVTVLSLFTGQVIGVQVDYLSVPCFGVSLVALLGSLYFFIRDVTISLMALELEIAPHASRLRSEQLPRGC